MKTVDGHMYLDGRRVSKFTSLEDAAKALETPGTLAWIGLHDADQLTEVADQFGLHPLALEDAHKGHQRAKLERYGETVFVVLRPGTYDDQAEQIAFGEIHLFIGTQFVITLKRGDKPDVSAIRRSLESEPDFLGQGTDAMLTALLDEIVDGYVPVIEGLENDVDEVEDGLFAHGSVEPGLSERIYLLLEQVIAFQRAIGPLPPMVHGLLRGAERYGMSADVHNRLRNVLDHIVRLTERVNTCRALMENALTVHSTLVSLEQNEAMRHMASASYVQGEEVKKISSWAAILFTPTLIAAVYGMNFDHIPELHWDYGYPFAVALMIGLMVGLWGVFRRRHWL